MIVVQGGRITAVGGLGQLQVPAGIRVPQDNKRIVLVLKEGNVCADRRSGMHTNVVTLTNWKKIDYL